ncbi:hypothetical protein [Streptomyces sp. NPDC054837]
MASATESAILALIRRTPVAAASTSQAAAPVPIARNWASVGFVGFGVRSPREASE